MPKLIKTKVEMEGRITEEYALVDEEESLRPWGDDEELGIVGYPMARIDGAERASGEARYTYDVRLPGMAYAALITSPHPHARVMAVDAEQALRLPGVLGILTRPEVAAQAKGGIRNQFSDELRFAGEIVAVIAATDPDVARDAARLVQVAYDVLPHASEPEHAAQNDAPLVGNVKSNVFGGKPEITERGNLERGFAQADAIVEHTYRTASQVHSCLEPHGTIAHWEGEQLTLYEGTQHVYGVRNSVARWLDLPQSHVRVVSHYVGGGFGSKGGPGVTSLLAPLLARKIRRPVQIVLDRATEQIAGGNRSASVITVKLGAKKDGTLTAMEITALGDLGGYGSWLPAFATPGLMMYKCPNAMARVTGVYTNTGTFQAFRAPGFVEGTFAIDSAIDELATQLGIDPLEFRRINLATDDQTSDSHFSNYPMEQCYQQGSERIGWGGTPKNQTGRYRRGIGMASQIWWGGGGPPAYATVDLNSDGTATLRTGTQDIGTGTKTVLAQVCAESLGLPLSAVRVLLGDSGVGQYAPVSGGSMTVPSMAPAVRSAAEKVRAQVLDIAAQMYDIDASKVELRDGTLYHGDSKLDTLKAMMRKLGDVMVTGVGSRGPNPDNTSIITSGAQFVEVEVDMVTGRVRVTRVVAAHDCGRIINPLTFRSQMEGGIIQAIGYALTEQRVMDHRLGKQLNANLNDYKLPTIADIPPIEVLRIDIPDLVANPTGAKGAGEPPIIPTAAAIANAVYDAIGVRIRELPITPDKVLTALSEQDAA